jgi:DNA-directed RNA polymerase subunit RPC12/RpoP
MSDFKFACPACGQRLSANDDYVGHQINCPACQAAIVVPPNPSAPPAEPVRSSIAIATPPGMPPPPAPPKVARLSVSALGSPTPIRVVEPDQQGSAIYQAHQARQPKKSYAGLIIALVAVALISGSAYLNKDWLTAKWKSIRGPSAAEIAATNQPAPPPPPPELTAAEIMQKVAEVYKEIPSFSSTGKTIAVLDMSALSPALAAAGPQTVAADLTLKMSKPLSFRIDSAIPVGPSNITVTGWSTGNGDFLQANNRRTRMPSHSALFTAFNSGVNVGVGEIVRLFINDTSDGLAKAGLEWTRNQDEKLNNQFCYVLAGTVKLQNVLVWVNRSSFLIAQTQVVMDGKSGPAAMDDAQIKEELKAMNNGKEPTLLDIANVKKMSKITGTITETYPNIQTNVALATADFEPPAPVAPARAGAPGDGGGAMGGGGRGGGRRGR